MPQTLSRALTRPVGSTSDTLRPNNSFKPTPLRSGKKLAKKACQLFPSTAPRGLTQVLGFALERIVGLFDIFKRKPPTLNDEFTAEEAELAPDIARIAGTVMQLQLSTASRFAITSEHDLNDSTWEITAFAFGILCAALEQKGIPWYKSPHVAIQFCDSYMPNYGDTKELARLVMHFGTQPEYSRYVDAGKAAMIRFANNPVVEPTPSDVDDLAVALGYRGKT